MTGEKKWFGVRCLFRHDRDAYEERITMWLVRSLHDAIEEAEEEAREYCEYLSCEYLGLAQAYGPASARDPEDEDVVEITPGMEVFSLFRRSDLRPNDYIDRFFVTGAEIERTADEDGA